MSGTFGKSSDRKLIERIANADKAAVQALFARFHVRIYRFIIRMVGNEAVAEELANEVFLDVWRQAGRFESRSSVSTWLMAIARNKAISHLRRKKDLPLDEDAANQIVDTQDNPEVVAQKSDKGAAIREAIDSLSPNHKAVIDLVYYHELSVREVAKVLDVPANTVKPRMFHARKKLAEKLTKAGIDRGWP